MSEKLFSQGKWKEAIAFYEKLIELSQVSADVYWNLSQCYRNLNLLDKYFQTLEQGIANYPTDGRFYFTLIIDLRRDWRTEEAIAIAEKACEYLPDDYTFKILKYLIVPSIYQTPEEIIFYRQRINLLSDVYLDTFTWSGGNTSLEAIACNLPIVTCPGEFMRGRHSDSFLKMLGVTDTIADNEQEYIDIAVKLGQNPAWRREISERISQRHDKLFDDQVCVAGLEKFYKQVVELSS